MGAMLDRRRRPFSIQSLVCFALIMLLAAPVPPSIPVSGVKRPATSLDPQPVISSPAAPSAFISVAPAAPPPKPRPTLADFAVRSVLTLDGPVQAGDYAWNEEDVAAGPLRVVVDLVAQRVYVYRGGVEIGRSSMIYGADDKPTPTGIYPILQKKRHHISNLYGAPMPYMLRLTMDGISLHASDIADDYATHGCIGLPDEFAALLFAEAGVGDLVLVTKDWWKRYGY